jgi:hypothetical protein
MIAARSAGGVNYSGAEPTTYGTVPLWQGGMNGRGALVMEWHDPDKMPKATQDQLIGLLATTPAGSAVSGSGTIEFEEY